MSGPLTTTPSNAIPVWEISTTAQASDGVLLPLNSVAQVLAYNGSNQLISITVVYKGNTYVQTYSYTGSNLTGISVFVKQ